MKWLREFVDFGVPVDELASRLTDAGLEVATVTPVGGDLDGVVVGRIEKVSRHPEAEKLSVCEVTVGRESLQIVCGAPNVSEKAKVPVALVGAELPGGVRISKSNLRGVDSVGMICSERELDIGEDEEGIMILEPELEVGQPLSSALELEDWILDFDLTPNRPDCLSIVGVAREVAALCGGELRRPWGKLHEVSQGTEERVEVEILDLVGCPRYTARVIEEVKIKESPFWLKRKLYSAGMRPINNVVDVANLVMLEMGHPLHAFDYDLFTSLGPQGRKKVVVRRAADGEKFITLDEVERTLNPEALLISDGAVPVAIAGIMGGLKSEVGPTTRNILLESAYFDPKVIRRGRLSLGLSTESSQRFERGADPNGVVAAADRVAELLETLAEGKVLRGVVDSYPAPIRPLKITLRPSRVNQLLSTDLERERIESILSSLDCSVSDDGELQVEVPTFRPDLTREIDLVEEVARIHGYGNIDTCLRAAGNLVTQVHWEDDLTRKVKHFLAGSGLCEVITNNLVDPDLLANLTPDAARIEIQNPLSHELSVLSTTLAYGLLSVVSRNKNRMEKNVRIFELGKVFFARKDQLPDERFLLGMAISGSREPRHWESKEAEVDLYDLKGMVERLCDHLALPLELEPGQSPFLRPDRSFDLVNGDESIGILGEVAQDILKVFGIKDKVFWAELDFGRVAALVPRTGRFSSLPKFPPVDRDLALVVRQSLASQAIRAKIIEVGGDLIQEVTLFDVYRGKQVPAGKKSLAYSICYRSREKTLTDEEVDEIHRKVISELQKTFGISLRE